MSLKRITKPTRIVLEIPENRLEYQGRLWIINFIDTAIKEFNRKKLD